MKYCHRLLLIFFLVNFSLPTLAWARLRSTVRIYAGTGTSFESVEQTLQTFSNLLSTKYTVSKILPDEIKNTHWQRKTALLIMPGGADIPYTYELNGDGNQKIRQFVENGGVYMGFCAGAYYAGAVLEFAVGDPYREVKGLRELAFFPGIVRGPTFPYLRELDFSGRVVHFSYRDEIFGAYYNGGGEFVNAEKYSDVVVLARYEDKPEKPAAIIQRKIGKGLAILSGIHVEYAPALMHNGDRYMESVALELESHDAKRITFLQELIRRASK